MKSYVLISGATGGLGKAFVAECASRGWDLFLTDLSTTTLQLVAQSIERQFNVTVLTYTSDLTDPAAREGLWEHARQTGLCFHMLINVAGCDFEGAFIQRHVDELRTIIRLNIENTVEMTHRVLAYRDASRTLRIINVSSLASFCPMPLKAVYSASKRFLLDFSVALNQELRAENVTVTALCPAGMPTTQSCIDKIDSQGYMGQITTMNVGEVAKHSLNSALAGRSVYIPGGVNRVLRLLISLFPAPFVAYLINKRWRKTSSKLTTHTLAAQW